MLSFLKNLFSKKVEAAVEAAPYKVEVTQQGIVAVGEPPATVAIPVAGLMLPVEGAGAVEVAPVVAEKKPRAKKPAAEKTVESSSDSDDDSESVDSDGEVGNNKPVDR